MERSAKEPTHIGQSGENVAGIANDRSATQSNHAAHRAFVERNAGVLPETIGEGDLEILNHGLGHLFALLREARRLRHDEGDAGRAAAFAALGGVWQFIALFERPLAELLHLPILDLQDALAALEENNVLPILKRVARHGRARSSNAYLTLKGRAAGTVKRLTDTGLSRPESLRAVADLLRKLGIRSERGAGNITATTVKNWCVEVDGDVSRRGTAALAYDSMFARPEEQQRLASIPKGQARKLALAELEQWVELVLHPQKTI
jgi:hypothetical protein